MRLTAGRRARLAITVRCLSYLPGALLFCCSPLLAQTNTASKPIRIVFRFDDASATSDTRMETRLIEAFREHRMCCTWSVIPCPSLAAKGELFAEAARAGVLEIALHGYSHKGNGVQKGSEFAGLSYEDQLQRIRKGKEVLEAELRLPGPVSLFVPPWNSYDANTVRALEAAQFRCLSADPAGPSCSSTAPALLPCTCSIAGVQRAVRAARAAADPNPVIVVLFHAYDLREVNDRLGVATFDQFGETLRWLARQPDVKVVPMSEVSDLSRERYLANQRMHARLRWLPRKLRVHMPYSLVFLSAEGARNVRHMERLRLAILYGGVYGSFMLAAGTTAFAAAYVVFARRPGLPSRLLWLSGPVLLAGSLLWAFHGGHFSGRIRVLAAVLGAMAWCAGLRTAKRWCKTPLFARRPVGASYSTQDQNR